MWGSASTCGGTCSCPRCGYTWGGGFDGSDSYVAYSQTGSNGYRDWSGYDRAIEALRESAKVYTKWRIWHRPAIPPRLAAILPLYTNSVRRPMLRAASALSTTQYRKRKRRAWQHSLRRSLAVA